MGEEIAATPGWVSGELDDVLGALPADAGFAEARAAYTDCLADCKGPPNATQPSDPQFAQQRCRRELLTRLTELGLGSGRVNQIGDQLEAIEDEISDRT